MKLRSMCVLYAQEGDAVVLCGYEDGSVLLRDVEGFLAPAASLRGGKNGGHQGPLRVVFSVGTDNLFITGGDDGGIYVWQLAYTDASADPAAAGGAPTGFGGARAGFGGATGGFGGGGGMLM